MVLINAKMPNTKMTSKKVNVSYIRAKIAIAEMRLTPITSIAMTRSGKLGPIMTRTKVIAIEIPNKISEVNKMIGTINVSPP